MMYLDKDPIKAASKKMDETNGKFIQAVHSRPFAIKMFSSEGHDMVHKEAIRNGIRSIAYFDGTASLFEY